MTIAMRSHRKADAMSGANRALIAGRVEAFAEASSRRGWTDKPPLRLCVFASSCSCDLGPPDHQDPKTQRREGERDASGAGHGEAALSLIAYPTSSRLNPTPAEQGPPPSTDRGGAARRRARAR